MNQPSGPTRPATYGAYRGVLLAVLAIAVFLFGLIMLAPSAIAVAEALRNFIGNLYEGYSWKPL